jgi:hypothetical protein
MVWRLKKNFAKKIWTHKGISPSPLAHVCTTYCAMVLKHQSTAFIHKYRGTLLKTGQMRLGRSNYEHPQIFWPEPVWKFFYCCYQKTHLIAPVNWLIEPSSLANRIICNPHRVSKLHQGSASWSDATGRLLFLHSLTPCRRGWSIRVRRQLFLVYNWWEAQNNTTNAWEETRWC